MKTLAISTSIVHPDEQQILLLRAALLQEEPALTAWRAWRVSADLDQLPFGGFGLLPLLAYNLRRYNLTDPLLDKCQGIHRRTWTQNQLLVQGVTPLLQMVQQAHITPILGGALALALFHYPDQRLRMVNRIDLLTATPQPSALLSLLSQAGWQRQQTWRQALRARLVGGAQPQRFSHAQFRDVHLSDVHLQWQNFASLPYPPLLNEGDQPGRNFTLRGVAVQCVSVTDLFFELCVQGISDLQRYGSIQWIADAGLLLQSTAPAIDWTRIVERSTEQAFTLRMIAALACLHQTIGAAIPPTLLQTLAALPSYPFERWEMQLSNRLPNSLSKSLPTGARKFVTLWLEARRSRWQAKRRFSF